LGMRSRPFARSARRRLLFCLPGGLSVAVGAARLVTGGDILAQQLNVHVFPNARLIPTFLAQYPPPPKDAPQVVLGRKGWYIADKLVCNALVGSQLLLSQSLIAPVKAAQSRVVADLRRRCAGAGIDARGTRLTRRTPESGCRRRRAGAKPPLDKN
jgi:hypothetical protein